MRAIRSVSVGVFLFVALLAGVASAQQATIVGTVTDESKAVLPGVTVTVSDMAKGTQVVAVTDARGEYRVLQLTPGDYKVQAELGGFASVVQEKIVLLVGQNISIPITMKVATLSETLTVTGQSPLVDTRSTQVAGNINPTQMQEVPLLGRNWLELAKMVPGMTANVISTSNPGVNANNWAMNLDGQAVGNKTSQGLGQPKFSREAIAEYQIVTNLYDVTQGGSTGVQLQAITKSGTNSVSGSGYGFFRDDSLNAADAVSKTVLPYHDDQSGRDARRTDRQGQAPLLLLVRVRADAADVLQPVQALGQSTTIPNTQLTKSLLLRVDDQLTTNDRLSVRGTWSAYADPFYLQSPSNTHPSQASDATQGSFNVLGTWSKVVMYLGRAGNQGRTEALLVRLRPAHHRHGVARAGVPRSDGRSGELDAAVARAGLRVGPLRSEPAQGVARLQAWRRVHQRQDVGRLPRPRPRSDDVYVAAARHRQTHSGLGGHEPGRLGPHRPQRDRPALQHQLPEDGLRVGDSRSAVRTVGWRYMAREQQPHHQLRYALHELLGRCNGARHHPELDPDHPVLDRQHTRHEHPVPRAGRLRLQGRRPRQPRLRATGRLCVERGRGERPGDSRRFGPLLHRLREGQHEEPDPHEQPVQRAVQQQRHEPELRGQPDQRGRQLRRGHPPQGHPAERRDGQRRSQDADVVAERPGFLEADRPARQRVGGHGLSKDAARTADHYAEPLLRSRDRLQRQPVEGRAQRGLGPDQQSRLFRLR